MSKNLVSLISKWHEKVSPKPDVKLALSLVNEEYKELIAEFHNKIDNRAAAKEAADLIWVAIKLIKDLGFDPEHVLREVAESNESKFFNFGHDGINLANQEAINIYNRQNSTEMKRFTDGTVGLFKPSGKLAKGPFYEPVDYSKFDG